MSRFHGDCAGISRQTQVLQNVFDRKSRITTRIPDFSGFFFQCLAAEFYADSGKPNFKKI